MRLFFLFFLILIIYIYIGETLAIGFSPSNLIFDLEQDKEECRTISLNSDSETITLSDKWAENKDIEWKVNLFDIDASYHGISISYPEELSLNEREVKVCLSGNKIGEYHGIILLREEQKGTSIIEMGIWLKAIINEKQESSPNTIKNSSEVNNGGGSTSNSQVIKNPAIINEIQESPPNSTEDLSEVSNTNNSQVINNTEESNINEKGSKITGAVIRINNKENRIWAILIISGVLVGLLVYYKKRRKN